VGADAFTKTDIETNREGENDILLPIQLTNLAIVAEYCVFEMKKKEPFVRLFLTRSIAGVIWRTFNGLNDLGSCIPPYYDEIFCLFEMFIVGVIHL
jgi:hypothetical protein